ncbi:MAG: phospholipid carrier-dependent glycosyltransferase [Eubacteriales bacterium]|nr:phospholipid carrier-dependent glycosyltransferase [Eubacteriales bacterium]
MMKKLGILLLCMFLLVPALALGQSASNLITNGDFESLDEFGDPSGWYATSYRKEQGYSRLMLTDEVSHSGKYAVSVQNASLNDARYTYNAAVEPNALYRLSAYVLVAEMGDEGNGANLAIEDIYSFCPGVYDTNGDWQLLEWYGRTGENQNTLCFGVRVGGYGSESIGHAYFDDVSLVKVDAVPDGVLPAIWYSVATSAADKDTAAESTGQSTLAFIVLALGFGLLYLLCRPLLGRKSSRFALWAFSFMMLVACLVRIFLAERVAGYQVDINCFTAWSLRMADKGPVGFYAEDYFCDYPPGYMLLLWPIGLILRGMGVYSAQVNTIGLVIVKSLPILCDLLGAIVLFTYGRKKLGSAPAALIGLLYAFSPAMLVNGAAWGQADSVLALFLLLCTIFAMERKWQAALPLYTLAILIKPQALLFAPVAGLWLLQTLLTDKNTNHRKRLLMGIGLSIVSAALVIVPFSIGQEEPIGWLIKLYSETLGSYAYATLNTANLYYLLAANWKALGTSISWLLPAATAFLSLLCAGAFGYAQKKKGFSIKNRNVQLGLLFVLFALYQLALAIFGANYMAYGYGMMALVYGFTLLCMLHDHSADRLPFYLAISLIGVYVLGIKVHERYLFPALALLLLGYLRSKDMRLLHLFVGFSMTTFVNTAIVLDNSILFGSSMGHLNDDTLALNVILSALNLVLTGYGAYVALRPKAVEIKLAPPQQEEAFQVPPTYEEMLLRPKKAGLALSARDYLIMAIVSILYGVLAFTNLGSTVAPQDGWVSSSAEEQVVFELPENQPFYFMYYCGVSYNSFSISVSDDGINWSKNFPCEMREGLCYRWNYALQSTENADGKITYSDNSPIGKLLLTGKYLRVNAESAGLNMFEIALRNQEGEQIPLILSAHLYANPSMLDDVKPADHLINEQDTCVGEPGWYTGTYFDEIYHARTAYEHLHGQNPYETTHPPLGKLLMAVGIAIFGMTPFGWRFAGAFVGALMLPAMYLLAKQLFKRRDIAAFSMIAFALDLMHYTQTRIATIDSFPVFFILLSYLCMVRYMQTDVFAVEKKEAEKLFTRAYKRSLIPLGLCGLFMGLSIASKWIGLYSAVGLAVLFFSAIYRQFRANNYAYCYLAQEKEARTQKDLLRINGAQKYALNRIFITCGFCVLFFLLVPAVIYYLSYIPYLSPNGPVTLQRIVQAQVGMLNYHSTPGLGMDHPFQSPWWQWPFILKPMWFAQDKFEPEGFASTIMCMGNPWVFYIGAICMAAVIVALVVKHIRFNNGMTLRRGDGDLTLYTLVVAFAAQYLPWVLVPRSMYMYHYFASVPFIILATAWVINLIPKEQTRLRKGVLIGYLAGAALFFVMFFPYASGWLTSTQWMDAMKWFSKLYY